MSTAPEPGKPNISAQLVKELREKTGAGVMDCRAALVEAGGDLEQAVGILRKKGQVAAAKKAQRATSEGLVTSYIHAGGKIGVLLEVNCETDFVARNDAFQGFVQAVTALVLSKGDDLDALKAAAYPGTGRSVGDELTHLIATIGENMALRRAKRIATATGVVVPYVHSALATGLGKIGALVALESSADAGALQTVGRQLAMHVAAANPSYLDTGSVDQTTLDREREILRDRAKQSGKPDAIIDKIVEGQLRKFYEESVLLEQVYVIDGESRVGKVVEAAAKAAGAPIRLAGYARFKVGEGIEKAS